MSQQGMLGDGWALPDWREQEPPSDDRLWTCRGCKKQFESSKMARHMLIARNAKYPRPGCQSCMEPKAVVRLRRQRQNAPEPVVPGYPQSSSWEDWKPVFEEYHKEPEGGRPAPDWPERGLRAYMDWVEKQGVEIASEAMDALNRLSDRSRDGWMPARLADRRKMDLEKQHGETVKAMAEASMRAAQMRGGDDPAACAVECITEGMEGSASTLALYAPALGRVGPDSDRRRFYQGSRTEFELLGLFLQEGMSRECGTKILKLIRTKGFCVADVQVQTYETLLGGMRKLFGDARVKEVDMHVAEDGGQKVVFYYRDAEDCVKLLLQDPQLAGRLYLQFQKWEDDKGRRKFGPANTGHWWYLHQKLWPRSCIAAVQVWWPPARLPAVRKVEPGRALTLPVRAVCAGRWDRMGRTYDEDWGCIPSSWGWPTFQCGCELILSSGSLPASSLRSGEPASRSVLH